MKLKLEKGFTLSEVLVTLGIIGVISAMTLPTLIRNHQRQVFVTQLHKVVNVFSQAFEQVMTDSNAVNLRESRLGTLGAENFLRNYFKTVKICSQNSAEDCFASEYKNMNGTTIRTRAIIGSIGNTNSAGAVLADGVSVFIYRSGADEPFRFSIVTDINGSQGPNILGRDLFDFVVNNNGTISVDGDVEDMSSDFSSICSSATDVSSYGGCFAKILNDGWKMDY